MTAPVDEQNLASAQQKTPVTIVTGALGAGKTTLVNATLRAAAPRRVAVIVNEFGDIGIDGQLVGATPSSMLEIKSGCLCCTVRDELEIALAQIARTEPDQLLVETTGVADPGPVIASIARCPALLNLDAIVCVVDARNFLAQLADCRRPEIARQVELASTIALSKADLAGADMTRRVRERIMSLNPIAEVHLVDHGLLPLEAIIGRQAFAAERAAEIELRHGAEGGAQEADVHEHHDHSHADSHHHHDADGHDHGGAGGTHHHGGVQAISARLDGELELERLTRWLYTTLMLKGDDLNRIKGILAVESQPNRVLVHGVQDYLEIATGAPWDGDRRSSVLVAIGHGLDERRWQRGLERCAATAHDAVSG